MTGKVVRRVVLIAGLVLAVGGGWLLYDAIERAQRFKREFTAGQQQARADVEAAVAADGPQAADALLTVLESPTPPPRYADRSGNWLGGYRVGLSEGEPRLISARDRRASP